MSDQRQVFLRAAARIHERLMQRQVRCRWIEWPKESWERSVRQAQLRDQVCRRGWWAAAARVESALLSELRTLSGQVEAIQRELQHQPGHFVASQRHIFEDLLAIEQEFAAVEVQLKEARISVTTESINLERTYLGPFRISLSWNRIGQAGSPYDVAATDPQPAASSSDIVHPHVNGERLCEGEGNLPIREALKQGRLLDFFTIVHQTLTTYNSESAYVQLSHWNGIDCSDCGYTLADDEDRYGCPQCCDCFCSQCVTSCYGCDTDHCKGCLGECADCKEAFCPSCLTRCRCCQRRFCEECLDDGRCHNCQEPEDEEPGESSNPVSGAGAQTPQHAGTAV